MTLPFSIVVIGAGPAGMMAALQAAAKGAKVTLYEQNAAVGRKLSVTGSGRCNITNQNIQVARYISADQTILAKTFAGFGHSELVSFLESIAVPVFATSDGWCYPCSLSAASVVSAFSTALKMVAIDLHLGEKVETFSFKKGKWLIQSNGVHQFDRIVMATGGRAHPNLGSRGWGMSCLANLGHTIIPAQPALAPVLADMRKLHKLQGVRMDIILQIWHGNKPAGESLGNAIFTQWGLNGPAAMDLSYLINKYDQDDLHFRINFLGSQEHRASELLDQFAGTSWPVGIVLGAFLPPKVVQFVLQDAGISVEITLVQLKNETRKRLWQVLTATRVAINGTRGFEFAQTSAGGVPVTEVDPLTMGSLLVPGLYLAGEVLDVTGPCGGYNLQFAFSSGALAGRGAAWR